MENVRLCRGTCQKEVIRLEHFGKHYVRTISSELPPPLVAAPVWLKVDPDSRLCKALEPDKIEPDKIEPDKLKSNEHHAASFFQFMHRGFVTRYAFVPVLALLLVAAGLPGQQPNPAQEPAQDQAAAEPTVGLMAGDQVEAHFLDFPEAATLRLTVSPGGTIFVPYAGQVKVGGMMPQEAESAVVDALKAKEVVKAPQVALEIVSARNLSVMVLGAVAVPHQVPLFSPAPLSYVLAQVGPIGLNANYHILVAHRDGSMPDDVELDRTGSNLRGMNTMVRPGDIVSVITAGSFFALGEFYHPGVYPIIGTQHMTLLQAVTTAGGPDLYASLSKARILRNIDGHREEIMVDLAKLHDGKVADPLIQTDDILFLPRSNAKVLYNGWLNQSLFAITTGLTVSNFVSAH